MAAITGTVKFFNTTKGDGKVSATDLTLLS